MNVLAQISSNGELSGELGFAVQLSGFCAAMVWGWVSPGSNMLLVGVLTGAVWSAIGGYIIVGGGGQGGVPALVMFPLVCMLLFSAVRFVRRMISTR